MNEQETTFVTVRMPADLVKQIDELAMEAMRSRSAQVIMMLKQAAASNHCQQRRWLGACQRVAPTRRR